MKSSRSISDLHPIVADLCRKFITECKAQGITILITCTYRDYATQNALYAQGRTKPGRKVTNARGGYSYHNFHVAFDFVPIVNGKAQWHDDHTFTHCGEIGEKLGLEWAGRWIKFKETAHMQLTQGHNLAYFRAGGTLTSP